MTDELQPTADRGDALVSYRSGTSLVICDPKDPRAWIESTVSQPVGEADRGIATATDRAD